jgi:hypothetical protein
VPHKDIQTDEGKDGQTDRLNDRWVEGQIGGWTGRWTMKRQIGEWTGRWTDGCRDRQTDDGQMGGGTDRQIETVRQTDRQTDGHTVKLTDTHADRQTGWRVDAWTTDR